MEYRYFKCNVLGGFRLSDINKNVKQGEFLQIDAHVCETSRAVIAAIRSKWMVEVSEKDAAKSLNVEPEKVEKSIPSNETVALTGVATHNASETNIKLESRQAEKQVENTVAVAEVKKKRGRPKKNITVATPDFEKVGENLKKKAEDTIDNKDRVLPIPQPNKSVELAKEEDDEFETLRSAIEGNDEAKEPEISDSEPEVLEEPMNSVKEDVKAEVAKRATFRRKAIAE